MKYLYLVGMLSMGIGTFLAFICDLAIVGFHPVVVEWWLVLLIMTGIPGAVWLVSWKVPLAGGLPALMLSLFAGGLALRGEIYPAIRYFIPPAAFLFFIGGIMMLIITVKTRRLVWGIRPRL